MEGDREIIWTQLATIINNLCNHKIDKEKAYWQISYLFEIATPEELEWKTKHMNQSKSASSSIEPIIKKMEFNGFTYGIERLNKE